MIGREHALARLLLLSGDGVFGYYRHAGQLNRMGGHFPISDGAP